MTRTPLISVVIPSFNRAHSIRRAIQSVVDQDYPNLEILVVDDGSTDDTDAVIRKLNLPELRYLKHTQNYGANAARNTGVKEARGDYVAFQDSDDYWEPQKLSIQVKALQLHGADVCFCAFNRQDNEVVTRVPKPSYGIQPGCAYRHTELLRGSFISCQTLVVSKQLLIQSGMFNELLPRLQDWDLCLRLAKTDPILFVDETLVQVDVGDDSMTRQVDTYASAANMILNLHGDDFRQHPEAAAMLCANVALNALKNRHFGSFAYFLTQSITRGRLSLPSALRSLYLRK